MRNTKKLLAALLALSLVMALCGTASAAKFTKEQAESGLFVDFIGNAQGYDKASLSSKSNIIIKKGSIGLLVDIKGSKWGKVVITDGTMNARGRMKELWFDVKYLKKAKDQKSAFIRCLFVAGGDGMSVRETSLTLKALKGKKIITASDINLRKYGSLQGKSQGVVKKGKALTCTGVVAADSRLVVFFQIKYHGKKYYVSSEYIKDWEDVIAEALEEEGI